MQNQRLTMNKTSYSKIKPNINAYDLKLNKQYYDIIKGT
jgi:hypothetical protein